MRTIKEAARPPSDSALTVSHIMGPQDTNLMGTVHGGVILKLIDSVAGVVAAR
ncbi:hotdog domain-containing protein, partial [Stackebrandtia soli]|uniref:hotdog domain-containing protein n=1 Tax=Stackebrandtia soli TaxID=1892856 RepID=UPI0039ECD443